MTAVRQFFVYNYTMQFKLLFKKQINGGYLCYVPSLPGCVVEGETIDEATQMAYEVIPACLSIFEEEGVEIIDDSDVVERQLTIPFVSRL